MWDKWSKPFPTPDAAQHAFRQRVAQEVDQRGTIHVLRNGVKGNGCKFFLCAFKPAHGLTPLLVEQYQANQLTVTRQQRYSSKHANTLDLCLWVNGLVVATVELKNELTGQTVEDAKAQYRIDRDPKDPLLARRAIVHFAVDPYLAFMTTRLAGPTTEFLPFNQGHNGHAGNPPASGGKHATAYLWEEVWQRDAFLDLLGRFVHTEVDDAGKATGKVIFPRFHQWDCVLRLEAEARANGPGHRYLAQHSAGSGKSNSIAWLARQLTTASHQGKPAFGSVIAFSVPVDVAAAEAISSLFVECIVAPSFAEEAVEILGRKKNLRVLAGRAVWPAGGMDFKRVRGGLLVQDRAPVPEVPPVPEAPEGTANI